MAQNHVDPWDSLWGEIQRLLGSIETSRPRNVNSGRIRQKAKQLVQDYFRSVRPSMSELRIDLSLMDEGMQELLSLGNGRNRRTSYLKCIRRLMAIRKRLDPDRELRLGQALSETLEREKRSISRIEAKILDTLKVLIPTAALSYEQALLDLSQQARVSFRGTAAELREVLREVLDHLAPDEAVISAPGFTLERDRTRPTMKQKVRFILTSRGLARNAAKVPEEAVSSLEEHSASLARSVYERGSLATHIQTTRQEAQQLKMYVDSVLSELLEVHK